MSDEDMQHLRAAINALSDEELAELLGDRIGGIALALTGTEASLETGYAGVLTVYTKYGSMGFYTGGVDRSNREAWASWLEFVRTRLEKGTAELLVKAHAAGARDAQSQIRAALGILPPRKHR